MCSPSRTSSSLFFTCSTYRTASSIFLTSQPSFVRTNSFPSSSFLHNGLPLFFTHTFHRTSTAMLLFLRLFFFFFFILHQECTSSSSSSSASHSISTLHAITFFWFLRRRHILTHKRATMTTHQVVPLRKLRLDFDAILVSIKIVGLLRQPVHHIHGCAINPSSEWSTQTQPTMPMETHLFTFGGDNRIIFVVMNGRQLTTTCDAAILRSVRPFSTFAHTSKLRLDFRMLLLIVRVIAVRAKVIVGRLGIRHGAGWFAV
mmetsp:Transcript_32623/g.52908  ORF Transcript_32623/g.52908 Transcript_32623/m.52908 type:complete len:259 (+) Transcript_32623:154-930(+)